MTRRSILKALFAAAAAAVAPIPVFATRRLEQPNRFETTWWVEFEDGQVTHFYQGGLVAVYPSGRREVLRKAERPPQSDGGTIILRPNTMDFGKINL